MSLNIDVNFSLNANLATIAREPHAYPRPGPTLAGSFVFWGAVAAQELRQILREG